MRVAISIKISVPLWLPTGVRSRRFHRSWVFRVWCLPTPATQPTTTLWRAPLVSVTAWSFGAKVNQKWQLGFLKEPALAGWLWKDPTELLAVDLASNTIASFLGKVIFSLPHRRLTRGSCDGTSPLLVLFGNPIFLVLRCPLDGKKSSRKEVFKFFIRTAGE